MRINRERERKKCIKKEEKDRVFSCVSFLCSVCTVLKTLVLI